MMNVIFFNDICHKWTLTDMMHTLVNKRTFISVIYYLYGYQSKEIPKAQTENNRELQS